MALRGTWVYEFDELDSFRGKDATRIKSFITGRVDSYRPAYGRRVIDVRRQCVFAGSTNEEQYLVDVTGNRRFWCVRCGAIDVPAIVAVRDQLWAEAYARYDMGEPWYIASPELEGRLREEQAEREEIDPWVGVLQTWLERLPDSRRRDGVTSCDALVNGLEMNPGATTRRDETRIGHCLKAAGWVKRREMRGGRREYRYYPTDDMTYPSVGYPDSTSRAPCT